MFPATLLSRFGVVAVLQVIQALDFEFIRPSHGIFNMQLHSLTFGLIHWVRKVKKWTRSPKNLPESDKQRGVTSSLRGICGCCTRILHTSSGITFRVTTPPTNPSPCILCTSLGAIVSTGMYDSEGFSTKQTYESNEEPAPLTVDLSGCAFRKKLFLQRVTLLP